MVFIERVPTFNLRVDTCYILVVIFNAKKTFHIFGKQNFVEHSLFDRKNQKYIQLLQIL